MSPADGPAAVKHSTAAAAAIAPAAPTAPPRGSLRRFCSATAQHHRPQHSTAAPAAQQHYSRPLRPQQTYTSGRLNEASAVSVFAFTFTALLPQAAVPQPRCAARVAPCPAHQAHSSSSRPGATCPRFPQALQRNSTAASSTTAPRHLSGTTASAAASATPRTLIRQQVCSVAASAVQRQRDGRIRVAARLDPPAGAQHRSISS